MALDFSILPEIDMTILSIEKQYQDTKGLILTEDDLKCILYSRLNTIGFQGYSVGSGQVRINNFPVRSQTMDNEIYANYVHTELTWYDGKGKLRIKPDITILEPRNLSILHRCNGSLSLPSKGCQFSGKAIIFELKFIRNKRGITKKTFCKIFKDFIKIKKLFSRLRHQGVESEVFCYFIIFNKTDIKCPEFEQFIKRNEGARKFKIIYATGKIVFPNLRISSQID